MKTKHILILLFFTFSEMKSQTTNVIMYQKFELNIDVSSTSNASLINSKNPFKKEEIILEASFTNPNGIITKVNGFYYEDFSLKQDANRHTDWPYLPHQYAQTNNKNYWKVRFTPTMEGTWTYNVKFYLPSENEYIGVINGQINCTPATDNKDGFISLVNSDYFAYSDGSCYIPLGINLFTYPEWQSYAPKVNFFELYFKRLSENGGNMARIGINCYQGFYLQGASYENGCTYYLDNYSMRNSYMLDSIIKLAEFYNIRLHIRLFVNQWFGDAEWNAYNTYNKNMVLSGCGNNNNGVCTTKNEFLTLNSAAIKQNNYLKYVIDRWGYSPSIAAWEIFAECEVFPNLNLLVDWHRNKINLIKAYDKYSRAVTTSFAGAAYDYNASYYTAILSMLDFVEIHRYSDHLTNNSVDFIKDLYDKINYFKNTYKKPVIITEGGNYCITATGYDALDIYENKDPHGFAYHQSMWSNLFQGVSAPYFDWVWYAFIKRKNSSHLASDYMKHIMAINNFTKNLKFLGTKTQIASRIGPESCDKMNVYYITDNSDKKVFGWVVDENFLINNLIDPSSDKLSDYLLDFNSSKKPTRASVTNTFTINNLPFTGSIKISWYDTENGLKVCENTAIISSKKVTITIPSQLLGSNYGDATFIIESSNTVWQDKVLVPSSTNTVLSKTEIKFGNGQIFYARENDGKLEAIYKSQSGPDIWVDNWVYPNAPYHMKSGSVTTRGLEVIPQNNNEIFYVGSDYRIHRLYYSSSSWKYEMPITASLNISPNSELHFGNGQLFYVRNDGIIHALYKNGPSWVYNYLNPNAPRANTNCGFELVPQNNNEIYYVGSTDSRIYRMYWTSSNGWISEVTSPSALNVRVNSELHYGNGQLFYINNVGILHALYKTGSSWVYNWLNPNAPKVKNGTGFALIPEQNNTIYYIGSDNNIYRMYYTSNMGWLYEQINIVNSSSGGAKENTDLVVIENDIFYVAKNDSKIHRLEYVYSVPFSVSGNTVNKSNDWDVQGTDGADISYKFYLPQTTKLNATLCSNSTNFDTKLEIFKEDGTRTNSYNDDYTCSYSNLSSTINNMQLSEGYYYAVVDGYSGASGNFKLSVSINNTKSALFEKVDSVKVLSDTDDFDTFEKNVKSEKILDVQIYPNPATNNLNIVLPTNSNYIIELNDISGKLIKRLSVSSQNTNIDFSNINAGVYLLRVLSCSAIYQQKIVISK